MRIYDSLTLIALAQVNPKGCVHTTGLSRDWYDHALCFASSDGEDLGQIFGDHTEWTVETHHAPPIQRVCMYCKRADFTPWPEL